MHSAKITHDSLENTGGLHLPIVEDKRNWNANTLREKAKKDWFKPSSDDYPFSHSEDHLSEKDKRALGLVRNDFEKCIRLPLPFLLDIASDSETDREDEDGEHTDHPIADTSSEEERVKMDEHRATGATNITLADALLKVDGRVVPLLNGGTGAGNASTMAARSRSGMTMHHVSKSVSRYPPICENYFVRTNEYHHSTRLRVRKRSSLCSRSAMGTLRR